MIFNVSRLKFSITGGTLSVILEFVALGRWWKQTFWSVFWSDCFLKRRNIDDQKGSHSLSCMYPLVYTVLVFAKQKTGGQSLTTIFNPWANRYVIEPCTGKHESLFVPASEAKDGM